MGISDNMTEDFAECMKLGRLHPEEAVRAKAREKNVIEGTANGQGLLKHRAEKGVEEELWSQVRNSVECHGGR